MDFNKKKKGYSLAFLMIAFLVISVGIALLAPMMFTKKDTYTNTSEYVKQCIVNESAASIITSPHSIACEGAIKGLTNNNKKDYETALLYLNDATYSDEASLVIGAGCDDGAEEACNVFIHRCVNNSGNCDNQSTSNVDLGDYLRSVSGSSLGVTYLESELINYYNQGMTNLNNTITTICAADVTNISCLVGGISATATYTITSAFTNDFSSSGDISFTETEINLPTEGSQTEGYFVTTDTNQITDIMGGITSFSVSPSTASQPTGTLVKGLISFDGRTTWVKWDGDSWETESTDLSTYDFETNGNTIDEIQTGLTNYTTGSSASLDFVFWLQSNAAGDETSSINSVTVTFFRER